MSPRVLPVVVATVAVAGLLAPVAVAARVSFSGDSLLDFRAGDWSVRWYETFLHDRRWAGAAVRSLGLAAAASGVATVCGLPLALALTRRTFRGRRLLAAAALLPAAVPPAVLGLGLLPLFHAVGLWGTFGGLALAHGLLGLPVVYLIARSHLDQAGPNLEMAARGLGASPWQAFRLVTLPLLRPALLAGGAAAYVISLNESLLTLFLSTPSTETLPVVVWSQLRYAASPLVAVASVVSAAAALVGALAALRLVRS